MPVPLAWPWKKGERARFRRTTTIQPDINFLCEGSPGTDLLSVPTICQPFPHLQFLYTPLTHPEGYSYASKHSTAMEAADNQPWH